VTRQRLHAAADAADLSLREKALLHAGIERWNTTSNAFWPTVRTFGADAECSEKTAGRHLRRLGEKSMLLREKRRRRGRQTSNLYRLGPALLAAAGMPDPGERPDQADIFAASRQTKCPPRRDPSDLSETKLEGEGEGAPPEDSIFSGRRLFEIYAEEWSAKYRRAPRSGMIREHRDQLLADLRGTVGEAVRWAAERGAALDEREVSVDLARRMIRRWLEEIGSQRVHPDGYLVAKQHPFGALFGDHIHMLESALKAWTKASGLRKPLPPEPAAVHRIAPPEAFRAWVPPPSALAVAAAPTPRSSAEARSEGARVDLPDAADDSGPRKPLPPQPAPVHRVAPPEAFRACVPPPSALAVEPPPPPRCSAKARSDGARVDLPDPPDDLRSASSPSEAEPREAPARHPDVPGEIFDAIAEFKAKLAGPALPIAEAEACTDAKAGGSAGRGRDAHGDQPNAPPARRDARGAALPTPWLFERALRSPPTAEPPSPSERAGSLPPADQERRMRRARTRSRHAQYLQLGSPRSGPDDLG
jgi:hypothetical protein